MKSQDIFLPRKLTNQLLHLAQQSPDIEVCGLVAADSKGAPTTCYPIKNIAETPQNRFLMDSSQQIAILKHMREKQEFLFAIFHSHPKTAAEPSSIDLEQNPYPQTLQLIISLNTKGVLEMRGFSIIDNKVEEHSLRLI